MESLHTALEVHVWITFYDADAANCASVPKSEGFHAYFRTLARNGWRLDRITVWERFGMVRAEGLIGWMRVACPA